MSERHGRPGSCRCFTIRDAQRLAFPAWRMVHWASSADRTKTVAGLRLPRLDGDRACVDQGVRQPCKPGSRTSAREARPRWRHRSSDKTTGLGRQPGARSRSQRSSAPQPLACVLPLPAWPPQRLEQQLALGPVLCGWDPWRNRNWTPPRGPSQSWCDLTPERASVSWRQALLVLMVTAIIALALSYAGA
jgi:hypothetical protein